jgi:hypothetical protein
MATKLVLGPILGLEADHHYTVTFVSNKSVTAATVNYGDEQHASAKIIGEIYSGLVWRCDLTLLNHGHIAYKVLLDDKEAQAKSGAQAFNFYAPAPQEQPKIAYASCNGFSDFKLMTSTDQPYRLWQSLKFEHEQAPFSLLLLGGDQVYADSIWTQLSALKQWNELGRAEKVKRKASQALKAQIDRFFSELYVDRWNVGPVADMLASIPSLMMWDDHDIFDGWGSYPADIQNCDIYQAIFAAAKKHFELLQVRGTENTTLLAAAPRSHFSAALKFRGYTILALDNRAERTLNQVMSKSQWQHITDYLDQQCQSGDLLLLSAVPVVYRDFSFSERMVDATPWEEELTDDLKDHWRAKEHQGERLKLIMRLLANAKARSAKSQGRARTVILSGDVHIGCLGVIRDTTGRDNSSLDSSDHGNRGPQPTSIHQVVSSAIVHPAPTYLEWLGILALTNDDTEYLDETRTISAEMLKPHGSAKYIRTRNFVTLLEGTDHKLWVNWICEGKDKPAFPLQ